MKRRSPIYLPAARSDHGPKDYGGLTQQEIADRLGLARVTVAYHERKAMAKLAKLIAFTKEEVCEREPLPEI